MPDGQEEINRLSDKLRESHNRLTETLLEIVREKDFEEMGYVGESRIAWSSVEGVRQIQERRDRTPLGAMRRRLYAAEFADCQKLAAMWRRLIEKEEQRP